MALVSDRTQKANVALNTPPRNGSILVQRIKELSATRWGKEIVLIGNHPTYLEALQKLEQFAQSDEPVLITGETGVGKELFARALYLLCCLSRYLTGNFSN